MLEKDFLMIPGPTPVPESVLLNLAKHPIGHRSKEFSAIFADVNRKLKAVAKTNNDVFIYTASGTGAMEAAIANTINPGDKVLSLVLGNFGKRFADLARCYGANVDEMVVDSGKAIDPSVLKAKLVEDVNKEIQIVTLTHSETATGTANDLQSLVPIIKEHGALVIVDGITSLGCMELNMDELGIDILVSGSQKGFMIPPGLSFIYVSSKAYEYKARCKSPVYYFCFEQARKSLAMDTTPWTPNVSHIIALNVALDKMIAEGIDNVINRHTKLKNALRAGVKALGLDLLTDDTTASSAITAIVPPESISVPKLRKIFRDDWGITVANGQKHLKDKIFRMGHLGFVCERDILMGIASLEAVLSKMNYDFRAGSGIQAANAILNKA